MKNRTVKKVNLSLSSKSGIEEFHRKYVLVPADKAANKSVVVRRLHYIDILKQGLSGTKA